MAKVFFTTVSILLALCPAESQCLDVTGVVGGKVAIKCTYLLASDNNKYFCKEPCTGEDILIQTGDSNKYNKEKYNISDFRDGSFTVTIKDLNKSDSGTYWCGVDRLIKDTFTEVYLRVTDAPPTPPHITSTSLRPPVTVSRTTLSRLPPHEEVTTTTTSSSTTTAAPINKTTLEPTFGMTVVSPGVMMYTGAVLGLLVFVFLLLLLIFFRQRNILKRPSDSGDKRISSNPIYSSSTNQLPDMHDIIMDEAATPIQLQDNIYSNIAYSTEATDSVSSPTVNVHRDPSSLHYSTVNVSRDPSSLHYSTVNVSRDPSSLHYSSVSFKKDSDVSNHPDTDTVTYSSVRGQQHGNEDIITYSAIKP